MNIETGENTASTGAPDPKLIARYLAPMRALVKQLERQIQTGATRGLGNAAIRNYNALAGAIRNATDDAFIETFTVDMPMTEGSDAEKANAVLLSAGQLVAYLEEIMGETEKREEKVGPKAVNINFSGANFAGVGDALEKVREVLDKVFRELPNPDEVRRKVDEAIGKVDDAFARRRERADERARERETPPDPPPAPGPPPPPDANAR